MNLSPSREHYIKAIYELDPAGNGARVSDIASLLGVTKASASRAVKLLCEKNLAVRCENLEVSLTPKGESQAVYVNEKYRIIKQYFMALGVDEKTAAADACAMEHIISFEVSARMDTMLHARPGSVAAPALFRHGNP